MNLRLSKSRGLRLFAVAALTIPLAILAGSTAQAASGPYLIDGNIPDADVAINLTDPAGNVKELGPVNSNTTKIGVINRDVPPTLEETNPNAQVDLRQAWIDTARQDNKDWLYFAWERDKNTGSGFIAYEFMANAAPAVCADYAATASVLANCNPWANRQAGDFMILWDQQGGGLDLFYREWSGTAPNLTLGPAVSINASVGEAKYSADGFKGEAAVNLTDTVNDGQLKCQSFANAIPSTVTGNSDTADYKDTILSRIPPLSNCTSTTVTTPSAGKGGSVSIGTGVVAVTDSAVVDISGATVDPDPAGSVKFFLCEKATGTCATGGEEIGTTQIPSAATAYPVTVTSPTAHISKAGRYCWRGEYSGDSANGIPGSSDSSADECFTVTPVTPALSTTAGADVNLGQPVTDTANLTGTATQPFGDGINTVATAGAAAGGTITFKLIGPNNCTTLAHTSAAVPVSGNGTYGPVQFTPTAAGDYHWQAFYSGNSPNTNSADHNTSCTDTNEDVTVTSVPSSIKTDQQWVPNDSATVSAPAGTGNLAGSVEFKLYASNDCAVGGDAAIYTVSKAVSGASPQTVSTSNETPQTASGQFSWSVRYVSTNPAQRNIPVSCEETSGLTIDNGETVSSP